MSNNLLIRSVQILGEGGGKLTVNVERINNPHGSALGPCRSAPDPCGSQGVGGKLTVDVEGINTIDPAGGSAVNVEGINNQCRSDKHC